MNKSWYTILMALAFTCCGKKQAEEVDYVPNECRKWPPFALRAGFPAGSGSGLKTSDKKHMGLLLVHTGSTSGNDYYQHPSWVKAGWLAPVQLDNRGNLFTAPAPFINVLKNPADSQNLVYRVDAETGVMDVFAQLPPPGNTDNENPYGVLGLCFMCEKELLFAATVAGSTRTKENGGIYAIDATSGKIHDQLTGIDPFGIGISYIEGKRKLYFGKARTPEIFSVDLNSSGHFAGEPQLVLSLEGLGPRGDDKAKKIAFTAKGEMLVDGYEFNFNLIAPTEKQTTQYLFRYGANTEKWVFVSQQDLR
jgi:hypothetical protein